MEQSLRQQHWPQGQVHPTWSSWWFHQSTGHTFVCKVREGEDWVTWWRGLRTMEGETLSNDLVPRGIGNFLHRCRSKAMIPAGSLSPQWWSNHSAHSCSQRSRSPPAQASGHTGKLRTLQEIVTVGLGDDHRKNWRPHIVPSTKPMCCTLTNRKINLLNYSCWKSEKQTSYINTYVESWKMIQMNLLAGQE